MWHIYYRCLGETPVRGLMVMLLVVRQPVVVMVYVRMAMPGARAWAMPVVAPMVARVVRALVQRPAGVELV